MHEITIRIYWNDLSENMKQRLLKVFGDNMNWDTIPMCMFEINNEFSNFPNQNITLDSFLGDIYETDD